MSRSAKLDKLDIIKRLGMEYEEIAAKLQRKSSMELLAAYCLYWAMVSARYGTAELTGWLFICRRVFTLESRNVAYSLASE